MKQELSRKLIVHSKNETSKSHDVFVNLLFVLLVKYGYNYYYSNLSKASDFTIALMNFKKLFKLGLIDQKILSH